MTSQTTQTELHTQDGEVIDVLEYATITHPMGPNRYRSQVAARCVIAIPGGTFTEWRFIRDLEVVAA